VSQHARSGPKGRRPCLAGPRQLEPCERTPGRWVTHEPVYTRPALVEARPPAGAAPGARAQLAEDVARAARELGDDARVLDGERGVVEISTPTRGTVPPLAPPQRPRRAGSLGLAMLLALTASIDLGPSPRRR
jgi:hypothetical protein